jgi:hypothetical protein
MTQGERVWFKARKISGTLYNNGILTSENNGDTVDVDIGITLLVLKTSEILSSQELEDLNGTRIVVNPKQRRTMLPSAA